MSKAVYLDWQGDFVLDDLGRTVLADADMAFRQRIIRRLLTTSRLFDANTRLPIVPPDYVFEPTFGAGLRRVIGMVPHTLEIKRLVTAQILADPETSRHVRPQIEVSGPDVGGLLEVNIVVVREPQSSIAIGLKFSGAGAS